jgi:hypothetical protein
VAWGQCRLGPDVRVGVSGHSHGLGVRLLTTTHESTLFLTTFHIQHFDHIQFLIQDNAIEAATTELLQLRLKVLKLAQIFDHPGALASRQTSLPSPDILNQNRLLLLLLLVSIDLLIGVGKVLISLGITV